MAPPWPAVHEGAATNGEDLRTLVREHLIACQDIVRYAVQHPETTVNTMDVASFARLSESVMWKVYQRLSLDSGFSASRITTTPQIVGPKVESAENSSQTVVSPEVICIDVDDAEDNGDAVKSTCTSDMRVKQTALDLEPSSVPPEFHRDQARHGANQKDLSPENDGSGSEISDDASRCGNRIVSDVEDDVEMDALESNPASHKESSLNRQEFPNSPPASSSGATRSPEDPSSINSTGLRDDDRRETMPVTVNTKSAESSHKSGPVNPISSITACAGDAHGSHENVPDTEDGMSDTESELSETESEVSDTEHRNYQDQEAHPPSKTQSVEIASSSDCDKNGESSSRDGNKDPGNGEENRMTDVEPVVRSSTAEDDSDENGKDAEPASSNDHEMADVQSKDMNGVGNRDNDSGSSSENDDDAEDDNSDMDTASDFSDRPQGIATWIPQYSRDRDQPPSQSTGSTTPAEQWPPDLTLWAAMLSDLPESDPTKHLICIKWKNCVAFPRPETMDLKALIQDVCDDFNVNSISIKVMAKKFTAELHVRTAEDRSTLLASKMDWLSDLSLPGFQAYVDETVMPPPPRVPNRAHELPFTFRIHWVCSCPPYQNWASKDASPIVQDIRAALESSGSPSLAATAPRVHAVQVRGSGDVWVYVCSIPARDYMVHVNNAAAWLARLKCGNRARIYAQRITSAVKTQRASDPSTARIESRRRRRSEKRRLARAQRR